MRFIATADWQLGKAAHSFDDEARPRYQQARFDAVRKIGQVVQERGAEFVVVCGDVFESNQLDRKVISRTFEALRSIEVPVVFLPGNHDPLDALSIYTSDAFVSGAPRNVHVLRDSEPFEVVPGVELVGAPWHTKHPVEDLVARACSTLGEVPPGTTRVLVGHGGVSSLSPDASDPAVIDLGVLQQAVDDGRVSLAVLGDHHSTKELAPRIWYSGTPEVTDRREEDPGNVLLIEVQAGQPTTFEKVRTGSWNFLVLQKRLHSASDVRALIDRLNAVKNKECTAIWLALEGELSTAEHALLEDELDKLNDLFAKLDHWERRRDLVIIPDDADFAHLGLSGFALAALEELIEQAHDPARAEAAKDAMNLLYRFAGETK